MKRILWVVGLLLCTFVCRADDVDTRIPQNDNTDDKTFVLVIANEHYKHAEGVPYALNDGQMFALYCEMALGVPQKNIHRTDDATLNDMKHELQWLEGVMNAYAGEARAIVYYSGHGMPDEKSKDALLLPVDGYATDASSGLSTRTLYTALGAMPARQMLVFLDACFSGTKRDGDMLNKARGIALKTNVPQVKGNMVVFSAAQGVETAYPYNEKQHGMFTYYLLEKLQQSKAGVTLGELNDYVKTQVTRNSIVENGKSQTPTVQAPNDDWRSWKMAAKPAKKYTQRAAEEAKPAADERPNVVPDEAKTVKKALSTAPVDMPVYKIEGAGTGVQGTYLVKVTVTVKKVQDVDDDCFMRGAIHGVLFRGFSSQLNRQHQKPLAGSATAEQQHADFFNDFFTSDFRNYATADSESRMVMKVGKEYQVSSLVSVQKDQLRRYLEDQGILKKLTNGF